MGWYVPLCCYDLRFPFRNVQNRSTTLCGWPQNRIKAWDTLLAARAIENMSYVVAVNRIGSDANAYEYVGHLQVTC
jgi:predicted amidohydrolase